MLLTQLASFFLCSQLDIRSFIPHERHRQPPDQITIGRECAYDRCKEFLECSAPSETTCSCFLHLHKEMKAFTCPIGYFVVSESGSSDLPQATRFHCERMYNTVAVHIPPPTEYLTSASIHGILDDRQEHRIMATNTHYELCRMEIRFSPKKEFSFEYEKRYRPALTFPFKVGRKFDMLLLSGQKDFEVHVDGKKIFSRPTASKFNPGKMEILVLQIRYVFMIHFSYDR